MGTPETVANLGPETIEDLAWFLLAVEEDEQNEVRLENAGSSLARRWRAGVGWRGSRSEHGQDYRRGRGPARLPFLSACCTLMAWYER